MFTKSCGSCGQILPASTQGGDRCPYCHVHFGSVRHSSSDSGCLSGCLLALLKFVLAWTLLIGSIFAAHYIYEKWQNWTHPQHPAAPAQNPPQSTK